jgi:hypothetical protein
VGAALMFFYCRGVDRQKLIAIYEIASPVYGDYGDFQVSYGFIEWPSHSVLKFFHWSQEND